MRIPRLGIDARPVPLTLGDDGSLADPERPADIGWWREGPLPGAQGNAVFVGHLDSKTGPAVFYDLKSLKPGDLVFVRGSAGSDLSFRVREVEQFPISAFPTDRVYRSGGKPGLVLLTCGGSYDRAAGRYADNVVVFADADRA